MAEPEADSGGASSSQEALRDQLEELLEREYGHLPPHAVADVLYDLLGDWNARVSDEPDKQPDRDVEPPTGGFMETVSRPVQPESAEMKAGHLRLTFKPTKPDEASNLLGQALDVGALLVAMDVDAPLNTAVDVQIIVPADDAPIQTVGRVVHRTDDGTAVELEKLSNQVRERMNSVWRGFAADLSDTSHLNRSRPSAQTSDGNLRAIDKRAVSTITDGRPLTDLDRRIPEEVREGEEIPDTSPGELPYPARDDEGEAPAEWDGPGVRWFDNDDPPERTVDLDEVKLPDLLLTLSESKVAGVVTIEGDNGDVQLHLDDGFVVEYAERPRRSGNELGSMLKTAEWLDSDELDEASERAHEEKVRIERALLDLGFLTADQLRQLIAGRLSYLVRDVCEQSGERAVLHTFDTYPEVLQRIPPLRVHVSVESIIFKRRYEHFRSLAEDEQQSMLAEHAEDFPDLVDRSSGRIEQALLDPEHRQLLDWAVSGHRLEDVVTGSSLPPVETIATLFALESMALLRFDSSPRHAEQAAQVRDDLHVKQLSIHKASYFEVLNVHWSSYDSIVEDAYQDAVDRFDVSAYEDYLDEETMRWSREIKGRLDSAYRVLKERDSRHQYRKKIMPDYKIEHGIPALLKRADLAEARGQWDEAVDALRRVLELKPDRDDLPDRLKRIAQKKAVQAAE